MPSLSVPTSDKEPDGRTSFFSKPSSEDSENRSARPFNTQKSLDEAVQPKVNKYVTFAAVIVESRVFIFSTMLLTFYALTADDCRLLLTRKEADRYFDGMVIACIVVFILEVLLSSVGKGDYLFGFFFWLDLASTASLLLDLTFISTLISGESESEDNASNMRSGRTARLGARLGRILRILRLVRILKLYKTVSSEAGRRSGRPFRQTDFGRPGSDEEEWGFAEIDQKPEGEEVGMESRVGKKLSEMTTRKTILLILVQMLVFPWLSAEVSDQTGLAPEYAADQTMQAFQAYIKNDTDEDSGLDLKEIYEEALLSLIYYNNWFARENPTQYCPNAGVGKLCPDEFYGHLFWIGISSARAATSVDFMPLATLNANSIEAWEQRQTPGIYNVGILPASVKKLLQGPWDTQCDTSTRFLRGVSLLSEAIPGTVSETVVCPTELRQAELMKFFPRLITPQQFDDWHLAFYFDMRPFSRGAAMYSLILVVFLLVLLILWALMFTYDANRLIVHPVEKMIRNVMAIQADPLMATKMADNEFRQEEREKERRKKMSRDRVFSVLADAVTCTFRQRNDEPLETLILEKTIIKLGSLLALGFGEAGANIIKQNITGSDTVVINAMIPGTIVNCIIGVCRVRDFSIATEVLQSKINAFVNLIAEIIHGVADEFSGAPNKNNGDTFLVIWRVDQQDKLMTKRMAELSIVAFAKILGSVHRSPVLASYRQHPGLQFRLGPTCRVNVSFGLHAGWAVEGAVGSEFKIDASYLSPHVSIATNIERATHVYGVSLVLAESVVDLCNKKVARNCRLIDRCNITGSKDPLKLYCVDLDFGRVQVDTRKPLGIGWNTKSRFKARQFLETAKKEKLHWNVDVASTFDSDQTIQEMRKPYTVEFLELFNMGYQNYYQGEWQVAKRMLLGTRRMIPGLEDGPSSALLRYMEVPHQFESPWGWEGVRLLTAHDMELPVAGRGKGSDGRSLRSSESRSWQV
mmetsp:Transcript_9285/g.21797  ORF Transcript_9285/g.21797 Transcript_9285/m.21797 type:complete len:978 (+) Transcript_9285:158-3091(+)